MNQPQPGAPQPRSPQPPKPPKLWQAMTSVAAAFFGVQSSKNRERDFKHGKASHFIVMGLVATITFIGLVIMLVRLALRQAGQ